MRRANPILPWRVDRANIGNMCLLRDPMGI
jgi:hypothetical protein